MISGLMMLLGAKWIYVVFQASRQLSTQNYAQEEPKQTNQFKRTYENHKKEKKKKEEYQKSSYKRTSRDHTEAYTIPSPWELLGLAYGCERALVKNKYRALAKQYHPDFARSNGVDEKEAIKKMQKINAAYEEIMRSF